eukprot:TRINITY_DN11154_c0_g1_i1.p1 TRINITY_DN11154_c0_g1~~TRINITY_DN11154_c0_g1_i1.p1  ORF type:complete len:530 (+),score=132.26 TRINITY_DN11154_c0_g1_i1:149-1738(+)
MRLEACGNSGLNRWPARLCVKCTSHDLCGEYVILQRKVWIGEMPVWGRSEDGPPDSYIFATRDGHWTLTCNVADLLSEDAGHFVSDEGVHVPPHLVQWRANSYYFGDEDVSVTACSEGPVQDNWEQDTDEGPPAAAGSAVSAPIAVAGTPARSGTLQRANDRFVFDPEICRHTGLANPTGTECWMNATFQCLCATTVLRDYFVQTAPELLQGTFTRALGGLVRRVSANSDAGALVSLASLKEHLDGEFRDYMELDAHDCLLRVLQELHWSMSSGGAQGTLVSDNFAMRTVTQTRCGACGRCPSPTEQEPERTLLLDLPRGSSSVDQCMEAHFGSVPTPDYRCEGCGERGHVTQRRLLTHRPRYLVVQLKRFETSDGRRRKREDDIQVGGTLSMPGDDAPAVYELYGVVDHHARFAGSVEGGHYTARVRLRDGRWCCLNDSETCMIDVTDSGVPKISGPSPYLLWYRSVSAAEPRAVTWACGMCDTLNPHSADYCVTCQQMWRCSRCFVANLSINAKCYAEGCGSGPPLH